MLTLINAKEVFMVEAKLFRALLKYLFQKQLCLFMRHFHLLIDILGDAWCIFSERVFVIINTNRTEDKFNKRYAAIAARD